MPGIYDLRLAYPGSSEGGSWHMDKEELFLSRNVSSAHAMAMCGVECSNEGGGAVSSDVVRWVSENSFGTRRGCGGYVSLQGEWWRRYMFRMSVDRKYMPERLLPMLEQTPEPIPWWNLY